jgi:hypothetical protein
MTDVSQARNSVYIFFFFRSVRVSGLGMRLTVGGETRRGKWDTNGMRTEII